KPWRSDVNPRPSAATVIIPKSAPRMNCTVITIYVLNGSCALCLVTTSLSPHSYRISYRVKSTWCLGGLTLPMAITLELPVLLTNELPPLSPPLPPTQRQIPTPPFIAVIAIVGPILLAAIGAVVLSLRRIRHQ
ncbi:hypothetical protein Vafri_19690, partial [Volvox africanus]